MGVEAMYKCDGCFVESKPVRLGSRFMSISGRSHGFGRRVYEQAGDKAPDGWVAYDHIGCCYCPKCADSLGLNQSADTTSKEQP